MWDLGFRVEGRALGLSRACFWWFTSHLPGHHLFKYNGDYVRFTSPGFATDFLVTSAGLGVCLQSTFPDS